MHGKINIILLLKVNSVLHQSYRLLCLALCPSNATVLLYRAVYRSPKNNFGNKAIYSKLYAFINNVSGSFRIESFHDTTILLFGVENLMGIETVR